MVGEDDQKAACIAGTTEIVFDGSGSNLMAVVLEAENKVEEEDEDEAVEAASRSPKSGHSRVSAGLDQSRKVWALPCIST